MGIITLTDRISVRVTAKNDTESSNQKKRDGGNVASALGGTGLTDSEKEQLGESLGETVTGEDGRTYARSDKVAGVLKTIAENNKLSEPTITYNGIMDETSGNVYTLTGIMSGASDIDVTLADYASTIGTDDFTGIRFVAPGVLCAFYGNKLYCFSTEMFGELSGENYITRKRGVVSGSERGGAGARVYPSSQNINGISYSFFYSENQAYSSSSPSMGLTQADVQACGYDTNEAKSLDGLSAFRCMAGVLYGTTTSSGGAKVDPTGKTDAQIQKDLEDYAAFNNCKMTLNSGDTYIAVTDANGNPLYFLGT